MLATLLEEMDGLASVPGLLVIAATNRPQLLDAALTRPGRFDNLIHVPPPDAKARLEILQLYARRMPLAQGVDLEKLAESLPAGVTGAEIQNVCREAGVIALRRALGTPAWGTSRTNTSSTSVTVDADSFRQAFARVLPPLSTAEGDRDPIVVAPSFREEKTLPLSKPQLFRRKAGNSDKPSGEKRTLGLGASVVNISRGLAEPRAKVFGTQR